MGFQCSMGMTLCEEREAAHAPISGGSTGLGIGNEGRLACARPSPFSFQAKVAVEVRADV